MIALPSRARPKINAEINIVPYIDVMLVLLVIFMMTTPIIEQGVEVELPQAESNMVGYAEQLPTVITIDKQGNYYINSLHDTDSADLEEGEKVSLSVAIGRVMARLDTYPQMKVFLRADKEVNYGIAVQLMALLQQNGVDKIGIMTEDPE